MQPAARGRGKRLLYWFRTPPGVRVGRAPIDETAIRLLEQHNPDVEFDWTRILKAPPAAEAQGRRDSRDPRDRDQRGRREPRPAQRPRGGGGPPNAPAPSRSVEERPPAPAVDPADRAAEHAEHLRPLAPQSLVAGSSPFDSQAADYAHAEQSADPVEDTGQASDHLEYAAQAAEHVEPADRLSPPAEQADHVDSGKYAETAVVPDAPADLVELEIPGMGEERAADVGSASYVRLGAEGLVRLRARYAEVMARIAERPLEEAAREELKSSAERLNPDAWVTADEVSAALEQYETVFEALRGVVGRHPRNRDRGRR